MTAKPRRDKRKKGLDENRLPENWQELLLHGKTGLPFGGQWATDRQRKRAWSENRQEVMTLAKTELPLGRPVEFYRLDLKVERPCDAEHEKVFLYEYGYFDADEVRQFEDYLSHDYGLNARRYLRLRAYWKPFLLTPHQIQQALAKNEYIDSLCFKVPQAYDPNYGLISWLRRPAPDKPFMRRVADLRFFIDG